MTSDALFTIACVLIYVAAGVAATRFTYIRAPGALLKIFLASMVCSLFFSVGLAIGRLPVPVPTPILFCLWIYDLANREACIPTSEGCVPTGEGDAWILIPFLAQWAVWLLIFIAIHRARNFAKSKSI